MATSLLFGAVSAEARLKFAFAQPLAPGVIGVCWREQDPNVGIRLYRDGPNGGQKLADFEATQESFVHADKFSPGEVVRYRLVEVAGGKEISSVSLVAGNSAEMIAGGDWEDLDIGAKQLPNFQVSMPAPLSLEVAAGGIAPGKKCVKVTVPDGQARYSIGKFWFWVRPPTKYTFSFWTPNPNLVHARGSISVFTAQLEKSNFAKVTWYGLGPADEKDGWMRMLLTHELHDDERLMSYEIIPEASDNTGSIFFDNFSLIDEDIQYLAGVDVSKTVETAKNGLKRHARLAPADFPRTLEEIEALRKQMDAPGRMSVDDFLQLRAKQIALLRRLESVNTVFKIADLK
ncbi:MAG: hypothetical protein HY360_12090 [Verrucomicrobia bacterium]|nr:hypothetical protein [Verrucomicrobiota bacterium]